MRIVDIHGATNLEIVRGGTNEWYWATDYIHGDLYEAEELFLYGATACILSTILTVWFMNLCILWTDNILVILCMMATLSCYW